MSVTFEGKFFQLQNARLEPKPVQQGGIPIWLGAWGPLGMRRAAQLADAWLPGPTAKLDKLLSARDQYHDELRKAGKDPASRAGPADPRGHHRGHRGEAPASLPSGT